MLVVWLKRICKNLKNNMIIETKIILISSIVNITYFTLILTFIYIKITSKWYIIQSRKIRFHIEPILVKNVLLTAFIQDISSNFHLKFSLIRDKCSSSHRVTAITLPNRFPTYLYLRFIITRRTAHSQFSFN